MRSPLSEAEWATAPLNDPSNVDKKVWFSHNGNKPTEVLVTEVTKLCVIVGNRRSKLRVSADGHSATTPPSADWPEVARTDVGERLLKANKELRYAVQKRLERLSMEDVVRIAELFEIELPAR